MSVQDRSSFTYAAHDLGYRERVQEQITSLGLAGNVADLDSLGYTVVPDAAPLGLFDRIRQGILDVTREVLAQGEEPFNFGPHTSMMYRMYARGQAFAEAALTPKLTALMTYLLGEGYVANATTGSILRQGAMPGPLHSDNQFFPEPFPAQVHVATAIWCCDDFDGELGSTHVVPGSNHRYRHPTATEGAAGSVPVAAPRGSIVIWTGHTWHRSGGRTAPGERVALHTAFSRAHIARFEHYTDEEAEQLVAFDERFTRLLGVDLPYGSLGDSPDITKILALAATTQAQA